MIECRTHSKVVIHGTSKHRKARTKAGSDNGVSRDGGISMYEVDIDDVG